MALMRRNVASIPAMRIGLRSARMMRIGGEAFCGIAGRRAAR
jgi:hypothetical protein